MSTSHLKQNHNQCKQPSNTNIQTQNQMEVEFGTEFVGDKKRAANAVEIRVKNHAARYGFCQED